MKQKSIKKNMIMSIILTMSNTLFPIITYSYISRILTPVGTGKVAFVASVISYFSYIATLGIPTYGLREAAKIRDDKDKLSSFVSELFVINLISTIISYILLFFCILFVPKLYDYRFLFIIMSLNMILSTLGFEWLYGALEEYSYITKRSLIFKIIYIPLVFLLIRSEDDYLWYGFLTIFVSSANYICNFINIRKFVKLKRIEFDSLKKHLKPILVLFFASIVVTIYVNFDIIMIGFIKNEFEIGIYNTALKLRGIILSLSTAITSVIIPRISYYISKNDRKNINKLVGISLSTSLLLAFPIATYAFIYAEEVIVFLCGIEYISAVSTFRVLLVCVILLIFTNLFGNQLLIPIGKEKKYSQSVFVGMFINLILNFLLIPDYGAYGAAFGTLITELWNMIFMGYNVKEYIWDALRSVKLFKYFFALVVSSSCSFIFGMLFQISNIFIFLVFTTCIFFIIYYVLLLIMKEDFLISMFSKIINKFKK